jgi:hypothetical protein
MRGKKSEQKKSNEDSKSKASKRNVMEKRLLTSTQPHTHSQGEKIILSKRIQLTGPLRLELSWPD